MRIPFLTNYLERIVDAQFTNRLSKKFITEYEQRTESIIKHMSQDIYNKVDELVEKILSDPRQEHYNFNTTKGTTAIRGKIIKDVANALRAKRNKEARSIVDEVMRRDDFIAEIVIRINNIQLHSND